MVGLTFQAAWKGAIVRKKMKSIQKDYLNIIQELEEPQAKWNISWSGHHGYVALPIWTPTKPAVQVLKEAVPKLDGGVLDKKTCHCLPCTCCGKGCSSLDCNGERNKDSDVAGAGLEDSRLDGAGAECQSKDEVPGSDVQVVNTPCTSGGLLSETATGSIHDGGRSNAGHDTSLWEQSSDGEQWKKELRSK